MACYKYRKYEYIGIRVQDQLFKLGPIRHCSNVWVEGEDTGEELPGICVIDGRKAEYALSYIGDHAAIIGGNYAIHGYDPGELIISDPIVIGIIY